MTQRPEGFLGRLLSSRYRIIARLGEGLLSEVYLARHVMIDRLSAIKILRPRVAANRNLREQFLHEARAVNRIHHPNIVEITDYGETDDSAFLVMEYVPGEALSRVLAAGPQEPERAASIGLKLALALSRAHEMGVIHRDIRPSNVLVVAQDQDDIVKLTDFGAARLRSAGAGAGASASNSLGADEWPPESSPAYAAPELGSGAEHDERADLYALGVVVYECIAGGLPHDPSLPLARRGAPEPLGDRGHPIQPALQEILSALLHPNPEQRPRDAFEAAAGFRAALSAWQDEREQAQADVPATIRQPPRWRRPQAARMLTMPFDRIGAACDRAWQRVQDAARGDVRPGLRDDLVTGEGLMQMLRRLCALVAEDTARLAAAEAQAVELRERSGARIDELGLQRSRTLGWALTLAEQSERVRSQRLSGAHPVARADALLWEEATLDHVEEQRLLEAEELARVRDQTIQQLRTDNERLDAQHDILAAQLEGHVAALRALAGETWQQLEQLASSYELTLSV